MIIEIKHPAFFSSARESYFIELDFDKVPPENFEHDINRVENETRQILAKINWHDTSNLPSRITMALKLLKENNPKYEIIDVNSIVSLLKKGLLHNSIHPVVKKDEINRMLLYYLYNMPTKEEILQKLEEFGESVFIMGNIPSINEQKREWESLFNKKNIDWDKYWEKYEILTKNIKSSVLILDFLERAFLE